MKSRKVKVRATIHSGGSVEFDVDGVKAEHSRLKLDGGSGKHAIDFELHDHSGKNLQFDTTDPIWVGENCPCPPEPGLNSDQIGVTSCNPQTLSTVNENSGDARELRYQLNFKASDGSVQKCDPIIDNGGSNLM